ncbi:DUF4304 domain-containing protein [Actinoplanes sp. CA-054009]
MDRPVRRAYLDMISKQVWPALKAAGFQRSSGTFRHRSGDGDAIVLEFQGSTSSGGGLSLFYLNMAVAAGGWLRWQRSRGFVDALRLPGTGLSQWWNRLDATPEFVDFHEPGIAIRPDTWRLASTGDAERCGDLLAAALPRHVLPLIEEYLDHYRRIDESVRAGEATLPPAPANALGGVHFLDRADHPYLAWARSESTKAE